MKALRKTLSAHSPPLRECTGDATHYDYYGLSQQVAAVRNTPWRYDEGWEHDGEDPFISSFTHGPTGIPVRTDEGYNDDEGDNVQYAILPDLFGGSTGMMTDVNETLIPSFQHFDAFGVRLTDLASGVAEYRWRGQEGSETDEIEVDLENDRAGVGLVYMQSRYYDPETGRFLVPDALYISSLTTQGMNRYIYCNNDPVNYSDPSGQFIAIMAWVGFAIGLGIGAYAGFNLVTGSGINGLDATFTGLLGLTLALLTEDVGVCFLAGYQSALLKGFAALFGAAFAEGILSAIATLGLAGLALAAGILVGVGVGLGIGATFGGFREFIRATPTIAAGFRKILPF